jgi:hypothetical protein
MVKKKVQIRNNSGTLKPEDTHLSIQLSLDGFSFCLLNEVNNEIFLLTQYSFPKYSYTPHKHLQYVKQVFESETLLGKKYQSVNVTHMNELSSLVPKAMFDENNLADYLKFSHKIYKNDFITFDIINNHDLINVYIPFVNINNYFLDRFGSFNYKHFSTIFIKNLLDTYKFSEHPHMFVMVNGSHFEILAIADNKLQLYNSFKYKTKQDFIYYILFVAEQLNFNPSHFELIFIGKTIPDDEIYQIAKKYVRNIAFLEVRNKRDLNKEITEDMQREYFTLLHQY